MNTDLAFASIKDLRKLITSKKVAPQELLSFFIERFNRYDKELGSALEVFQAESIMQESACKGMLYGIPGLVKDNILQKGRKLTCASKILENFIAPYDATAIERLKQEGAFMIGRGNCDEFAMGTSTETSAYQKTKNPWNVERVPGGSSGGPIAAVAAGLAPWGLGSETGGSVRQPAALCGIVGLKPTYGLISRSGLVAYASSMDQIGIATRTVYDNALVLSAIAGNDIKDSSTLLVEKKDYTKELDGKLKKGLTIGVVENALTAEGIDKEVIRALEQVMKDLENLGAHIKKVSLPILDYGAAVYFILSRAEAASNLARFDGVRYGKRDMAAQTLADMYANTRHDGFGQEVKARIMIGNYVLSVGHAQDFYGCARNVQREMAFQFAEMFKNVDLIIMPTAPALAFKFGAFDENKLQMDLQDYFTCPMNIAGIPALSIPCGFSKDNLPIGFQIIGPRLSESLIYQTAHAYEQATQWHTMHPPKFS